VGVEVGADAVEIETRVAPAEFAWGARLRIRYTSDGDALGMAVRVDPDGHWPCTWARVGLRFRLPFAAAARWRGRGPGQSSPDSGFSQRLGAWSADLAGLRTDYVRPQESGSRTDVVAADLVGPDAHGLRITGGPFAFSANPWTAAQLDAAAHPTDLPDPGDGCWLTVDLAQHGLGTASCGPGVLDDHRLVPRTVEGALTLRRI
jgi:beta-galactosidase